MLPVTPRLGPAEAAGRDAASDLFPIVYAELRRLAAARLAGEKPGQTLQPTALVHEAYLKLAGAAPPAGWNGREHFFAAAAEAMRRILIDLARKKKAGKHGGDRRRVELDDRDGPVPAAADDILDIDAALTKLAREDPTAAAIVRLHFYAGLSIEETADVLGLSRASAYREWSYARAWLRCALGDGDPRA